MVKIESDFYGIEVKTGNAIRDTEQIAKDAWINSSGAAEMYGTRAEAEGISGQSLKSMITVWWNP